MHLIHISIVIGSPFVAGRLMVNGDHADAVVSTFYFSFDFYAIV
ncbi:hypothetical protein [Aquibacillus sediminis]|nr:hypothetical protein [Aquibacillus sediminis]